MRKAAIIRAVTRVWLAGQGGHGRTIGRFVGEHRQAKMRTFGGSVEPFVQAGLEALTVAT